MPSLAIAPALFRRAIGACIRRSVTPSGAPGAAIQVSKIKAVRCAKLPMGRKTIWAPIAILSVDILVGQ